MNFKKYFLILQQRFSEFSFLSLFHRIFPSPCPTDSPWHFIMKNLKHTAKLKEFDHEQNVPAATKIHT